MVAWTPSPVANPLTTTHPNFVPTTTVSAVAPARRIAILHVLAKARAWRSEHPGDPNCADGRRWDGPTEIELAAAIDALDHLPRFPESTQ